MLDHVVGVLVVQQDQGCGGDVAQAAEAAAVPDAVLVLARPPWVDAIGGAERWRFHPASNRYAEWINGRVRRRRSAAAGGGHQPAQHLGRGDEPLAVGR